MSTTTPAPSLSQCNHVNFHIHANVDKRLRPDDGTTSYIAEIRIHCKDCQMPFYQKTPVGLLDLIRVAIVPLPDSVSPTLGGI
jgi:hypothetical protein